VTEPELTLDQAYVALDKAIVDVFACEDLVEPSDLLSSFAVVASFAVDESDTTRYVHCFSPSTPHHAALGLLHTAIKRLWDEAEGT
jgi:hypothetical protein